MKTRAQMEARHQAILELRNEIIAATATVAHQVRRNDYIGDPVSSTEKIIRKQRDRLIARELAIAKKAIAKIERAAK